MKAKIFTNILLIVFSSILIATLFSTSPFIVAAILFVGSLFLPSVKGAAMMALQREIWVKDIIQNLYKDNAFAKRSQDHSAFVVLGKIVHMPVAGAPSGITKNLNSFPATITRRSDTELTYELDTYRTNPSHILNIENYELSYDKRMSVLGEDERALVDAAMYGLLYRWAPLVANTVLTTGTLGAPTLPSATGNRRALTKAEFANVKKQMDKQNISPAGRSALLTADHYAQFLESLSDAERTDVGRVVNMQDGIVGRYLGFDLFMRSSTIRYRGADGAYVAVDEQDGAFAANAADRAASLFWQQDAVARAVGETKMFGDEDRPDYYGNIYSFEQRLGGRIRRASGVWAAVEGNV